MWPFSNKEQFAQKEINATQSRSMMNEVAIYQVWDELAQETDCILEKLGKSRRDLMAIEFDDEVSAALETRVDALIGTAWRLEGRDDVAEFIGDQLKACMPTLLNAMFKARLYGYSVIETVYRRDNGRIVLDKAQEKPFYWFNPKRNGELLYLGSDVGLGTGVQVDLNKFILTQCKPTYDNPMGVALLSKLYWPVHYRKYGWQFWLKWLERYGFPSRVGKTPPGVLPEGNSRADDLSDSLQAMAQNSTIVIADDQDVELIEPSSNGQHFASIDDAVNKRIQKTVLGQTLTSEVGDKGSFAAAKVHDSVRDDKRMSDVRLVTTSMQHLVNVMVALNFPNESLEFIMEDERGLEIERAERDKTLMDAGAIELTEAYLLDRYDFNPGDFIVPENKPEPIPSQFTFAHNKPASFTPDQQVIEDLASNMPLDNPIKKAAIQSAIRAATSPEDLELRLSMVLEGADLTEFSQVLEKALFTADVLGFANAD